MATFSRLLESDLVVTARNVHIFEIAYKARAEENRDVSPSNQSDAIFQAAIQN